MIQFTNPLHYSLPNDRYDPLITELTSSQHEKFRIPDAGGPQAAHADGI